MSIYEDLSNLKKESLAPLLTENNEVHGHPIIYVEYPPVGIDGKNDADSVEMRKDNGYYGGAKSTDWLPYITSLGFDMSDAVQIAKLPYGDVYGNDKYIVKLDAHYDDQPWEYIYADVAINIRADTLGICPKIHAVFNTVVEEYTEYCIVMDRYDESIKRLYLDHENNKEILDNINGKVAELLKITSSNNFLCYDLKPDNVVYKQTDKGIDVRLIDFDGYLCNPFGKNKKLRRKLLNSVLYSQLYIYNEFSYYTTGYRPFTILLSTYPDNPEEIEQLLRSDETINENFISYARQFIK